MGTKSGLIRARDQALVAAALTLAVVPASHAQSAAAGGRQSRPVKDTVVVFRSVEARLANLRAELDSISGQLGEEGLNDSERRALVTRISAIAAAMANLTRASTERAAIAGTMSRSFEESMRGRVGGARVGGTGTTIIELRQGENGLVGPARERSVFKGWIGLNALGAQRDSIANGEVFIRYIGSYPRIVSVDPSSPAASAGILKGDLLVAYDGSDVVERGFSVTKLLQPSRAVRVTVDRDGDKRDFPVVVAPAPRHVMDRRLEFGILAPPDVPAPRSPRALVATPVPETPVGERPFAIAVAPPEPPQRTYLFRAITDPTILGARVEQINDDLSDIFGVSTGVVVIRVPDDSPARRSGLRGGDVIVKVDGSPLESLLELRRALERASQRDRTLDIGIIRNKKAASITLQW